MSIHERVLRDGKTRRWDAIVYTTKGQPPLRKSFASFKEAKKWAQDKETLKGKGEELTTDRRTMGEFLAQWLADKAQGRVMTRHQKKERIGPRTLDDYQRLLHDWILTPKHPELRLAALRVDKLKAAHLTAFYRQMEAFTTPRRIRALNELLGQAFHQLVRRGVWARNHAEWAEFAAPDARATEAEGEDCAASAMDEEQAKRFLEAARQLADEQEQRGESFMPERCWSGPVSPARQCGPPARRGVRVGVE